jgi:hypothetical protein
VFFLRLVIKKSSQDQKIVVMVFHPTLVKPHPHLANVQKNLIAINGSKQKKIISPGPS